MPHRQGDAGGRAEDGWNEFQQTGRVSWVSELAEIPEKYGVTNVYADVGQLFAQSVVAVPQLGAALMGIMGKGMGYDKVVWGTDAVWTGSPQWQIEALRRLEIPDDMQKTYGFKPLGAADGPIKTAIFGGTNARLYNYDISKRTDIGPNRDRFALMKPGAVLIQASRGGVVNEEALVTHLNSGRLGGAAVDVYATEPPDPDSPLFALEGEAARRVLFTPHIAGVTRQASATLFREAWLNVERVLVKGEAPLNRVY